MSVAHSYDVQEAPTRKIVAVDADEVDLRPPPKRAGGLRRKLRARAEDEPEHVAQPKQRSVAHAVAANKQAVVEDTPPAPGRAQRPLPPMPEVASQRRATTPPGHDILTEPEMDVRAARERLREYYDEFESEVDETDRQIELEEDPAFAAPPLPQRTVEPGDDVVNRRRQTRRPMDAQVTWEGDCNFFTGLTENISAGGLFIATRDLLTIGTMVPLSFTLPDFDRTIQVECEVRWLRLEEVGNPDCVPGMGLRFMDMNEEDAAFVAHFAQRRETIFYDDDLMEEFS